MDEPEHFERIPVRTELTVLSADNPKTKAIGFQVHEEVGVGIYNHRHAMVVKCPVCGDEVFDLLEHASGKDDRNHEILSVMET